MRKILLPLLIATTLTVGLSACGSPADEPLPNPDKTTFSKIDDAGEKLGDKAGKIVDQGVKDGAEKAKEFGKYAQSEKGKADAKKLGKKAGKAVKEIGGAVGDYLENLP